MGLKVEVFVYGTAKQLSEVKKATGLDGRKLDGGVGLEASADSDETAGKIAADVQAAAEKAGARYDGYATTTVVEG